MRKFALLGMAALLEARASTCPVAKSAARNLSSSPV